jgi:hypothetical protein
LDREFAMPKDDAPIQILVDNESSADEQQKDFLDQLSSVLKQAMLEQPKTEPSSTKPTPND